MRVIHARVLALSTALSFLAAGACLAETPEASLTAEDFAKLDTFESVVLKKADKAFASREYRSAAAAYDSFLQQFPRSGATPYALLRKGRCLQLDNKRFDAIKVYNEVMDYFPNVVAYAGAALYHVGDCHRLNGDILEAIKAWAEMARDVDYRKHVLAADAINQLADNFAKQEQWKEAAAYYLQVGVDFRLSNRPAAAYAIEQLVRCHVRAQPDEPMLRAAYDKFRTFEAEPRAGDDRDYWRRVMEAVDRYSNFAEADKDNRDRYYKYWARAMEGKHPDWDDFQITLARYELAYEGDATKWMERLDKQFAQYQKEGNYDRVVKWIGAYASRRPKVDEYYARLAFDKMSNAQILSLIRVLYGQNIDAAMARNAIGKLKGEQMTDNDREDLARWIWQRDEEGLRMVCGSMKDADRGNMLLVRFFRETRQPDKGLKLVDALTKVSSYAKEAYWSKGQFLQWKKQWQVAISAYRLCDDPPRTIFCIAECLLSDGHLDQAIENLREIENFFKNEAPEAGLRIAYAYRVTGDQKQYIASLRGVMKKYPKSRQSNQAHQELESLGIKIGGGVDAE
ncbi:MAG: tetratricopeptide repeat protein [Lentisphaerae bacterium]|nr:tetratricopeptide repeat protein [Lentisphaerota bacterium]